MLKIPQEDLEILRNLIRDYDKVIGNRMKPVEARQKIERGLLEICETKWFAGFEMKCFRSHSSNGLLLTRNGYFVTCFHCVDEGIENLCVVDSEGNSYPIEGVCSYDKDKDIAIVKAKMGTSKEHLVYRYDYYRRMGELSIHLTRRKGCIIAQGTHVLGWIKVTSTNQIHLCSKTISIPGDSGGIISNMRGELISIILGIVFNPPPAKKDFTATKSTPFIDVIDFIRKIL